MTSTWDVLAEAEQVFVGTKLGARLAAVRAYREAATLFQSMADHLEADPIDGPAFLAVEARVMAELGRAQAAIEQLKAVDDCRGEA